CFSLEIPSLKTTLNNLSPQEGKSMIQTRFAQVGRSPHRDLTRGGLLQVSADSATEPRALLLFVPDISKQTFFEKGLLATGDGRQLGNLRCKLTLTDNQNVKTSEDFELQEG